FEAYGLEGFDFPVIGKGMAQLGLRDASRSFRSRGGVAETKQEQTPNGIEDGLEPAHVGNAVRVGKNVKQAGVEHVIEAFGPLMEFQGIFDQELDDEAALGGLAPRRSDGFLQEVEAGDSMAPCGEEQGVFAGAATRIENRTDDLIGGGLERRLGLADVPGRAAGVGAAKGFAVVAQDVVRRQASRTTSWATTAKPFAAPTPA